MLSRFGNQVFPLSYPQPVLPGETAEVRVPAIPLGDKAFKPERLLLSAISTDWEILSLRFDDQEQLDQPLPSTLFRLPHASGSWLGVLRHGSTIRLEIRYQGLEPEGGRFFGVLVGSHVPASTPDRALSGPIRLRDAMMGTPLEAICEGPDRVLPGQSAVFVTKVPRDLVIVGCVLELAPEEWTIEDIVLGGRSQFASPTSAVPGDIFAADAVDGLLRMDPIKAGDEIVFRVTYRGPNPRGRFFGVTCLCQALRV